MKGGVNYGKTKGKTKTKKEIAKIGLGNLKKLALSQSRP